MGTLKERLERIKSASLATAPDEVKAVMARGEQAIRALGLIEKLPALPAPLPAFALADTEGRSVTSQELLARGPLVLTFYRGDW